LVQLNTAHARSVFFKKKKNSTMGRQFKGITETEKQMRKARSEARRASTAVVRERKNEQSREYRKRRREQRQLRNHPDRLAVLAENTIQEDLLADLNSGVVDPVTERITTPAGITETFTETGFDSGLLGWMNDGEDDGFDISDRGMKSEFYNTN
jgi:hypothetical protein